MMNMINKRPTQTFALNKQRLNHMDINQLRLTTNPFVTFIKHRASITI